jgi:hypothetical protein
MSYPLRNDTKPRAVWPAGLTHLEALKALQDLYAVTPHKAPGAGLIVGAEEKHRAAIEQAKAAIKALKDHA